MAEAVLKKKIQGEKKNCSFNFQNLIFCILRLANRSKVPPRPAGQRTEPEPNTTFQGFGFGDGGFQMSLGIGAFPFGIFTSTFNFGTNLRSQSMYKSGFFFFFKHFDIDLLIYFSIYFRSQHNCTI